jgi:NitT/TauT family transport system substrate-binding protein
MRKTNKTIVMLVLAMMVSVLAACGGNGNNVQSSAPVATTSGDASGSPASEAPAVETAKVRVQLKWVPQAQFAGVFVAQAKGFFEEEGIEAEIIPGGPDIIIEQQVVNGTAELGITALDSLLVNQDNGLPLVSVAQVLQKSSNRLVAKKSAGIDSVEKMKGKKIGSWMGSQQFQVLAFLEKNGLNPKSDIQLVKQGFTMDQFFNDQLDVASASIYNEYHVILENGYAESELDVYSIEDAGVAMLEDVLIAKKDWVESNHDVAVRAVKAILKGWRYAIENQAEAIDIVMGEIADGSSTREHQETMLKEISQLILPEGSTPDMLGMIDEEKYQITADIAEKYGLVKNKIDLAKVYDKSVAEEAANGL